MTVTIQTVATALGRSAPEDDSPQADQWEMWISDAELLIDAEANRRDVEPASLDSGTVDYVVREAVVAQVRRPDDATSVEIAIDDGREARRYSSGRGRVTILDEWWDLLFPTPEKTGKAYAVDTMPADVAAHAETCSLNFGATYCSCGASIAGYPIFEGA